MSYSVVRLTVHLENKQQQDDVIGGNINDIIEDVAGNEPVEDNLLLATMLTAFFVFNVEHPNLQYLYGEMPEQCVFQPSSKTWTIRQRRHGKTVARIAVVNPTQREVFALRAHLTVRRGPTSFRDLRTLRGQTYDTFLECAIAMTLVRDDEVYVRSFPDMAVIRMPHTLRRAFVTLIQTNMIADARPFWPRFADDMAVDYRNRFQTKTRDELHLMMFQRYFNLLPDFFSR